MAGEEREKKVCFLITPIGTEGSPTRKRADQVEKFLVRPVCAELGFEEERADNIPLPGQISTQIFERVIGASLVVADLTDRNANVFYELAVRHAADKPVVHIIQHDQELPFDLSNARTVFYNLADPETLEANRGELRRQIEAATKPGVRTERPFEFVLQMRESSGNATSLALQQLAVKIESMEAQLRRSQRFPLPGEHVAVDSNTSPAEMQFVEDLARLAAALYVADSGSVDMAKTLSVAELKKVELIWASLLQERTVSASISNVNLYAMLERSVREAQGRVAFERLKHVMRPDKSGGATTADGGRPVE